jgi:hypothetical protein
MSVIPVNVQIPSDPHAPMIADFVEHALRIAYVDRDHLAAIPSDDWDVPGVYILLTGDGSGQVYVGQARRMRQRLGQHNSRPKLPWTRAVMVKRDTTNGFNTAETGYLEGRVSAEVKALKGITLIAGQSAGDETLPTHIMLSLDAFVKSILTALRLAGVDISRAQLEEAEEEQLHVLEKGASAQGLASRATFACTVSALVSSGLLRAGEDLYLHQGTVNGHGTVTAAGEVIVNGVTYMTPSAAAVAALGLQSSNGWTTWHVGSLDGVTLDQLRKKWQQRQRVERAEDNA